MFSKIVISACILAVARGGLIAQPFVHAGLVAEGYGGYGLGHHHIEPAVAHTSEKVIRGPHNSHTVATQSRTIVSPHSISHAHFTQATNDISVYAHDIAPVAIAHHAAPVAIAAPIAHHVAPVAIAAPIAHHAAPVAIAAPIAYHAAPVAVAAPVAHHVAPVAIAHPIAHHSAAHSLSQTIADPIVHHAAPVAIAAPIAHHAATVAIAAPVAHVVAPLAVAAHTGYATVEHHGHAGLLGHGLGHGSGLLY